MKAVSLLYHDVIASGDYASSGFSVPGANRYKLDRDEFVRHLTAIAGVVVPKPGKVTDLLQWDVSTDQQGPFPFYLTFDDGGSSAWPCIAGLLERFGWRGHFLITAGYVGSRAFLGKHEIRALRRSGHFIGSHSTSHPERMSACSWRELVDEWGSSVQILSDILGEPVIIGSVPGGYYSRKVAEAAGVAGIRILFNSEPTTKCVSVNGLLVLGRYSVTRGMPPVAAARLASGKGASRLGQYLRWNCKRTAKFLGGQSWLTMRRWLLRGE